MICNQHKCVTGKPKKIDWERLEIQFVLKAVFQISGGNIFNKLCWAHLERHLRGKEREPNLYFTLSKNKFQMEQRFKSKTNYQQKSKEKPQQTHPHTHTYKVIHTCSHTHISKHKSSRRKQRYFFFVFCDSNSLCISENREEAEEKKNYLTNQKVKTFEWQKYILKSQKA